METLIPEKRLQIQFFHSTSKLRDKQYLDAFNSSIATFLVPMVKGELDSRQTFVS